jgi:hypothetical protein
MRFGYSFRFSALVIFLAMSVGPSARGQDYILASNRVTLFPLSGEMEAATSNDVRILLTNDAVLKVIVTWKSLDGRHAPEGALREEMGIMNFGPDGQAVIGVHPPMLGTLQMSVQVDFQDDRYSVASAVVNAVLPKKKPKTFELSDGSDERVTLLHLDLGGRVSARFAGIATYSGYKFPVKVDAAELKFAALPAHSPIEVFPRTGIVIAHAYGTALVRAKLGGHESDVCVVVSKDAHDPVSASCTGVSK